MERAKCKLCKETFIGKRTIAKNKEDAARSDRMAQEDAARGDKKAQNKAARGDKREQSKREEAASIKVECKACGWKGNLMTWNDNNGCPRCANQEYKKNLIFDRI